MNPIPNTLSSNKKRNKIYTALLKSCHKQELTIDAIIQVGYDLMRKARIHHHFFKDYSLFTIAEYLTYHALGCNPGSHNKITETQASNVIALFEKRIADRVPVEYLTHKAYYLDNIFYVNEHVLIPRSLMNTRFKDFLKGITWENYRVLDLCTGSGCIGISLALLNENIQVDLADISSEALAVANKNIHAYALTHRVSCIQSDLFENIQDKYDLIITNPPYVSLAEYKKCPAEFKREPVLALAAGSDGLDLVNKILVQSKKNLNKNGCLIAEVGYSAAARLKKNYPHVPFQWFKYRRPSGKESWLGMHGGFLCEREGLPDTVWGKSGKWKSYFKILKPKR